MRSVVWLLVSVALGACTSTKSRSIAPAASSNGGGERQGPAPPFSEDAGASEVPASVTDAGRVSKGCAALTGAGTMHGGSVDKDETWTAQGSPHFVPYHVSVGATLTLEPCAVVRIAAQKTITLGKGALLLSHGTEDQPILIEPDSDAHWSSIRLLGGTASLAYTRVVGGGAPENATRDSRGALEINGRGGVATAPDAVLFVDHVSIEDSASQGVLAHNAGGFALDSQALTISGSEGYAVTMDPNLLETLPEGSYTGNAIDAVLLPDDLPGQIGWDVTIHERGVPYVSGATNQFGETRVGAVTGQAVLTIEPGVVWRFKKGSGLLRIDPAGIPSTGVLIARGTRDKPIVFTSDEENPAAGDWYGILLGGDDARNRLDWVRIEYAGKRPSGGSNSCHSLQLTTHNGAALRVYQTPPATLVTNSTFSESATNGIDRGWRNDLKPSFTESGNTFTGVALCNETFPRDNDGACPAAPLPCPTTL